MTRPAPRRSAALLLAALPALTACAAPGPRDFEPGGPDDPATHITLAWLEDQPLTLRDALDTFLTSHAGHGGLVRGEPAVRELAGRIVERRLFVREAEALGIDRDPELPRIVDDYHIELAEMAFWRQEVDERIAVPDAEVEAFWEKTDVALDLTLVQTETREQAEALRARAAAGEDAGALAHEASTHASRDFDGRLGFVRRGELDAGLEGPAFALHEPGELTPVTAVKDGFAFARLDRRTVNPERPPREVALPQIRGVLESRAEDELRAAAEARVRAAAGITLDETLLQPPVVLGPGRDEEVVARSAGEALTLQGLRELVLLDRLRTADEATAAEALRAIADDWAYRRAVRSAVRRSGLMQRPDLARKAAVFREDALIKLLCDRYVYAGIELPDADVQAWYDTHVDTEFTRPAEVLLGGMLLADEDQSRAVLQRLHEGEAFGLLARELSRDPSTARNAGRAGWVRPGSVQPGLEQAAFALQPGEFAGPVATDDGPWVLTVFERREPQVLPFAMVREAARRQLAKQRQQEAYAVWLQRLRERADTHLDEDGVRRAAGWLEQQALAEEAADRAAREARAAAGTPPHGLPPGAPPHHPGSTP